MQQVFQEMDGVLRRNRETRRRNIGIRTYRVVPLKATTGVIQWVMGTIPVSGYLELKHKLLYPTDWAWNLCRKRINDLQHHRFEARLKMFQQICNNFHPVLRFFFLETFKNPDAWFSRQIQFSRSVAASSMIGHIVGLGDRHGHNILLDTTTGEVVHIDLGIAFEQVFFLDRQANI
jgi:ataxia telangiectasia mutated family protein